MKTSSLEWIQEWLASNCDGDWEHNENVTITTIDNPGWSVSINLEGTVLEDKQFDAVEIERSEMDWIHCKVKDLKFFSYGGARNLIEMLQIFIEWADSHKED